MAVLAILAAVLVLGILVMSWRNPIYFLVAQVLGRFLLDSFPQYTYVVAAGGLSVMQLFTIATIGYMIFYLTVKRGWSFNEMTIPVSLMVFVLALSAIYSLKPLGFAELGTKWIYLWLLAEFTLYTLKKNSQKKVIFALLLCYMYPLFNQVVYLAIGVPKVEAGIVNYMGTFDHESSLAFLLLGLVAISLFIWNHAQNSLLRILLLLLALAAVVGIYLNNYRTALPVLLVFFVVFYLQHRKTMVLSKRAITDGGIGLMVFAGVIVLGSELAEKLGDIWYVLTNLDNVFDFSGKAEHSSLLSGRVYLFNTYMYLYLEADFGSKIFGLGPRAGNEFVGVYAHNEYLSTLVEYGILGVVAFSYFLVKAFSHLRRSAKADWRMGPFYAMFVGLLVMSLATMPFHDARSLIFIAITIAFASRVLSNDKVHSKKRTKSTNARSGPGLVVNSARFDSHRRAAVVVK